MIWLILVIIVVGYFIVKAINGIGGRPSYFPVIDADPEATAYLRGVNERRAAEKELNIRICKLTYKSKSSQAIIADAKVRQLASSVQLDLLSEDDLQKIRRTYFYLKDNYLIDRFEKYVKRGYSNKRIARTLGTSPDKLITLRGIYSEDDIEIMRKHVT